MRRMVDEPERELNEAAPSPEAGPDPEALDEDKPSRKGKTPIYKRIWPYLALIPVAFVLGVGAGYLAWGRETAQAKTQAQAQAQAQVQEAAQNIQRFDIPEDDDPSIGPKNAPITIIEFSDYECPYCRRWYSEVYGKLREEYPDQVRIVFRDFPLTAIHPNAVPAAEAANCAGDQDAYWEFHDKLFAGGQFGSEIYLQYASELGLNMDEFNACIESGKFNDEVMGDYQYAAGLGVRSTPTFFLNGLPIVGAHPYDVFQQVIEKELAGEIP
jgi:protein-disulfide isomerase